MDVDMAPGVDFVERITEAVSACHVLIVVMGPTWATVKNDEGEARLADPEDFVRLEVETALRRRDVTPIPVLVGGAQMPNREDLPPELGALTRRNALELSNLRWRQDVGRLISTLDELLAESSPVPGAPFAERGAESEKAVRLALPSRGRPRRHQPSRPQRPWRPKRPRRGRGLGGGRGGRCSARWQSPQLWLRLLSRPVGAARPARRRKPVGAARPARRRTSPRPICATSSFPPRPNPP